jgi:hypothetical protein
MKKKGIIAEKSFVSLLLWVILFILGLLAVYFFMKRLLLP